jgi:ABC-type sugar transport system permease subunit
MKLLEKFQNNRNALGWAFMMPATVLLLLFLTYPLGLGTWLGFTDAKIGRSGEWVGLENFSFLVTDSVTQLALFNTLFYTTVASVLKFVLGLWLALLLNKNVWRGIPFVAISLLAGLQTISPSYYEASAIDGATPWQQFRHITLPLLTPIIAVVMTFSVLFTFTDFQLIYVLTRGGPLNATHLMATLAFQRAISGGALGEGAAIATLMVPFLLAAIMFSYFGLQRRAWQQGGDK